MLRNRADFVDRWTLSDSPPVPETLVSMHSIFSGVGLSPPLVEFLPKQKKPNCLC